MTWDYRTWVGCSVGISVGILVLTLFVLWILWIESDAIFYAIVSQLLNIERCYIDVHHNRIRKDEKVDLSPEVALNVLTRDNPQVAAGIMTVVSKSIDPGRHLELPINELFTGRNLENSKNANNETSNSRSEKEAESEVKIFSNLRNTIETLDGGNEKKPNIHATISPKSESSSDYEREVLNVYGKFVSVHKKGTIPFIMMLTTLIISGALIAAFNSLFLYTSSVYQYGPCPSVGPMECFCGDNHTYFACDTGQTNSCPLDIHSGACFRWTGRDITTSDITTQLGVTAGLLVAFGNIAQALIRIYLIAFNKRLGIATGIHRIAAKTIGINRHTARTRCLCCNLHWHCSACNLSLFKHPAAVIIVTGIYIIIPILMIPGVILLYYYEISVTSLTFIVLIVLGLMCILPIVWIMVQETEASANIPGGWNKIKTLATQVAMQSRDIATGKHVPPPPNPQPY